MNRTSEVETAMQLAQTGDASPVEITIAAYVEKLEKENFTLRWEPTKLRARAEAAEQRVKELEKLLEGTLQAGGYQYFYQQLHAAERAAHNARCVAEQERARADKLEAQLNLTAGQLSSTVSAGIADGADSLARLQNAEARVKELEAALVIANTHVDELTPLIAHNAELRAALENELAANLRAEAAIHGTTRAKFVLPQQERLKAALADTQDTR